MEFASFLLTDHPYTPICIAFIIGLPSLVLYIAEVVVLLSNAQSHRRFDTTFYKLFLARAIINIVNYFNSYVNIRFGRLGLFYPLYVQAGSLFIAINWFLN